jgi:hypothetical protein
MYFGRKYHAAMRCYVVHICPRVLTNRLLNINFTWRRKDLFVGHSILVLCLVKLCNYELIIPINLIKTISNITLTTFSVCVNSSMAVCPSIIIIPSIKFKFKISSSGLFETLVFILLMNCIQKSYLS